MSTRAVSLILGAAAIVAGVAGCGGSSSGGGANVQPTATVTVTATATAAAPSTTPTPSSTTSPVASPTPTQIPQAAGCTTGQLKLSLGQGQGAAGSTYQPIVFTNTGSAACTLDGYPGVSFVDSSGTQLGKPASRASGAKHPVTISGGGKASALLQLPDPGVFSPSRCNQTTASELKVYPPNQKGALLVPDPAQICTTKAGRTSIRPVVAGTTGE